MIIGQDSEKGNVICFLNMTTTDFNYFKKSHIFACLCLYFYPIFAYYSIVVKSLPKVAATAGVFEVLFQPTSPSL